MDLMKLVGESDTIEKLKKASVLWSPKDEHEAVTMKGVISLVSHMDRPITKNIGDFLDLKVGIQDEYFNNGGLKMARQIRKNKIYEEDEVLNHLLEELEKAKKAVNEYRKRVSYSLEETVAYRIY